MGKFVKVATKAEISDQSAKLLKIGDKRIALFNLGGQFYAIDDTCPHADGPLSEGSIEGEEVECPWHGWVEKGVGVTFLAFAIFGPSISSAAHA